MAFLTTLPSKRLDRTTGGALRLRRLLESYIADAAAGDIGFDRTIDTYKVMLQTRDDLVASKSTANIGAAAQDEFANPAYDYGAEADALVALIEAGLTAIQTAAPTDGTWITAIRFIGFAIVERTGTPAQTASIRTALQAVVDAIA